MFSDAMAALDFAALCGVAAMARAVAGDHLAFFNWAATLPIEINALKMGVPAVLAVYAWVCSGRGYRADPLRALRAAAGVVLAMALARMAQNLLPARPRPRVALPDFPFPPLGDLDYLADWSSMPSDTAALAFALTAVAWASSRRLGAAAAAWTVAVTCFPRLYIGYHYLSDILAGAALGVLSVALAVRAPLPARAVDSAGVLLRRFDARAPALLPLAFFVLGTECFYVFESTRRLGGAAKQLAQAITSEPGGAEPPSAAAAAAPADGGCQGEHDEAAGCAAEPYAACAAPERPSSVATAD